MTWNNALPASNEKIRNLSSVITTNWLAIEQGNAGLLQWAMVLKDRTVAPVSPTNPAAISGAGILFAKTTGTPAHVELFYADEVGTLTQLTGIAATLATTGSLFLPGGLLMKWGNQSISGSGPQAVVFATAFPTATLNIQCTASTDTSQAYRATNASTTGFNIRWDVAIGTSQSIYWLAIGH